jgi:hypothetical protein
MSSTTDLRQRVSTLCKFANMRIISHANDLIVVERVIAI